MAITNLTHYMRKLFARKKEQLYNTGLGILAIAKKY